MASLRVGSWRWMRSRLPTMTPSRLLKSCATPPVSWPIASIFCDCRSIASACSRSATARRRASRASSRSAMRARSAAFTRRNSSGEGSARAFGSRGQSAAAVATETNAVKTFTIASNP
ncbi:hypothetical protein GMJLKIPL_5387 [Methylobacterium isbiliense]|uniref:Uncharacterized protein n=1 Tax=Methylobacterium isbiliense TaxID=315478 RepID=A0ABQ4SJS8_9HYPH|nr:hypothetical protein GMJLKIPL_5387 [Methylobacterium isbiliense]